MTRLDLMVGETCNLAQFIRKMPNLLDLGLTVFTKAELRFVVFVPFILVTKLFQQERVS